MEGGVVIRHERGEEQRRTVAYLDKVAKRQKRLSRQYDKTEEELEEMKRVSPPGMPG